MSKSRQKRYKNSSWGLGDVAVTLWSGSSLLRYIGGKDVPVTTDDFLLDQLERTQQEQTHRRRWILGACRPQPSEPFTGRQVDGRSSRRNLRV